jgi:hypothetical protein
MAQRLVLAALGASADAAGAGRVASEWRFRVTPPGKPTRPLVLDIAFVSFERLAADAPELATAIPLCADRSF